MRDVLYIATSLAAGVVFAKIVLRLMGADL